MNRASTGEHRANGETPLFVAARCGHVEVGKALLEAGADIHRQTTEFGETPLFTAAECGKVAVSLNIRSSIGWTVKNSGPRHSGDTYVPGHR